MDLLDRVPPQDVEAEASVLGAILLDNEAATDVAALLRPEQFYRPAHRTIYETMLDLVESRGQTVDIVILKEALARRGVLDAVGGVAYLKELEDRVPSAANAEHYARIVREKALLRTLIEVGTTVVKDAYESHDPAEAVVDRAERRFFEATQKRIATEASGIKGLLIDALDRLESGQGLRGLKTHFHDLDEKLAGLQKGELVILAARPSMGKTSLATSILRKAGCGFLDTPPMPCALFSLEMRKSEVAQNMLCAESKLDSSRVRRGMSYLEADERRRLVDAAGRLAEAPIYIDDASALTLMELRAKARRLKIKHGLELLVLDYLQLVEAGGAGSRASARPENRQQEISLISRGLKAIARELDIPVIALSQLSRQVEQRGGKHRPWLSDLRESGSLEQDADVVLLLYREAYYEFERDQEEAADGHGPQAGSGGGRGGAGAARRPAGKEGRDFETTAEVIIAKNRNGPTGSVSLRFFRESMRFESYAPL